MPTRRQSGGVGIVAYDVPDQAWYLQVLAKERGALVLVALVSTLALVLVGFVLDCVSILGVQMCSKPPTIFLVEPRRRGREDDPAQHRTEETEARKRTLPEKVGLVVEEMQRPAQHRTEETAARKRTLPEKVGLVVEELQRENAIAPTYTLEKLLTGAAGLPVYVMTTPTPLGQSRMVTFMEQCRAQGLFCVQLPIFNGRKDYSINVKSIAAFTALLQSRHEFAVLCQDDAVFIGNFSANLAATVRELSPDWQMLHLCPGFLWGRMGGFCDFNYHPEYTLKRHANVSVGGRAFINEWPGQMPNRPRNDPGHYPFVYSDLPGGPVSVLMTREGARNAKDTFMPWTKRKASAPDDKLYRHLAIVMAGKHVAARQPQLCHEAVNCPASRRARV